MGMHPEKHQAPKILKIMAVNYCGCQLDRWLGWAAPAYHKNEGATPHPGACNITGGLMGALGCGLKRGIGEKFVKNCESE